MIHMHCLAVKAGFYSDVVEGETIDRKVLRSILGWGMEIFYESVTGIVRANEC